MIDFFGGIMDNINLEALTEILTKEQIEKLVLVKNGDIGCFSTVYRLNETECIKLFNHPLDKRRFKKYDSLTKVCFQYATFPKRILIINDKIIGFIMDYVDGVLLDFVEGVDYSTFLKEYDCFMKKLILETCETGFAMEDFHSQNAIYNYKTGVIKAIDCDQWTRDKTPFNKNFEQLVDCFVDLLKLPAIYTIDEDTDFIDYYETFRFEIEKDFDCKIKTIGDIKSMSLRR